MLLRRYKDRNKPMEAPKVEKPTEAPKVEKKAKPKTK